MVLRSSGGTFGQFNGSQADSKDLKESSKELKKMESLETPKFNEKAEKN